ncbi:MAG: heme o synthase [Verrucomicrobiota bacterium]
MTEIQASDSPASSTRLSRADWMALTKARLSLLVVITTLIGFVAAARSLGEFRWMTMLHTVFGSALAAAAAAVFNQLMEIDVDAQMERTADRPLPARRMSREAAFGVGWLLAALGIVHLSVTVNATAAFLAGATLGLYVFVYTPMKRTTGWNTIVGAVAGALPPLIGWFGGGGGVGVEPVFLFGVLFFWQLPHFFAINWMYREQYQEAGFAMWANGDVSGARMSGLAVFTSLVVTLWFLLPPVFGFGAWWAGIIGIVLGGFMLARAVQWRQKLDRPAARGLFFSTLIYLPLALGIVVSGWK